MSYTVITNSGELYHHGILGQKWGKRNGPPYPLDASDHSASEKKAGWRKSLSKANSDYVRATKEKTNKFKSTRNELLKERKEIRDTAKAIKQDSKEKLKANTRKLRDNRNEFENTHPSKKYKQDLKNVAKEAKNGINKESVKKAAKIGAAVAVTGLAAYGGYKLYGKAMSERRKLSPYALKKMGIKTFRPNRAYNPLSDGVRAYGKDVFQDGTVRYTVRMDDGREYVKTFFDDLGSLDTDYQDESVYKMLFGSKYGE